jgi:hypothetical protein
MGFTQLLWKCKRVVIFGRKELKARVFPVHEPSWLLTEIR